MVTKADIQAGNEFICGFASYSFKAIEGGSGTVGSLFQDGRLICVAIVGETEIVIAHNLFKPSTIKFSEIILKP